MCEYERMNLEICQILGHTSFWYFKEDNMHAARTRDLKSLMIACIHASRVNCSICDEFARGEKDKNIDPHFNLRVL